MAETNKKLLVIEDDRATLKVLEQSFVASGFDVWLAESGEEACSVLENRGMPHLAVVDLLMPGMGGLEFCRYVKSWCDLPLVVLTSVDTKETLVEAIEGFAEDYIVKPFHIAEVIARLRRVLHRVGDFSYTLRRKTVVDERLMVDFYGQKATLDGCPVDLTPTESKLLFLLMKSAGRALPSSYLIQRIWPTEEVFDDTLRVHLHRLRRKIEPEKANPRYIHTQRGAGYRFATSTQLSRETV